jgi:hypothetical protein
MRLDDPSVAAVGRGDLVRVRQSGTRAHWHGLLARAKMNRIASAKMNRTVIAGCAPRSDPGRLSQEP